MESYNTYSNSSVSKFLRIIEFKNLAILLLVLVLCGLAGGFIIWSDKVVNNDSKPQTEYPDVKLTFTGRTLSSKCLVERIQDFRRIKIVANDSVAKLISIDNDLLAIISDCYISNDGSSSVAGENSEPAIKETDMEKIPLK